MSLDIQVKRPIISTARFDLRPMRLSDQGLWAFYAADRRVAEMTPHIPHPLPPGASEAFVTRATQTDRDEDVWVMDASAQGGGELMGVISLTRMDRGQSEISYWVAPQFWNSGLASEAVSALVAANPMQNETLFASVFQDNPASARVLVNCGFDYIGDAETHCVARNAVLKTWTYVKRMEDKPRVIGF